MVEDATKACSCDGMVYMKCSIPKDTYYASEEIPVRVVIENNSRRSAKSIHLGIVQHVSMEMINDKYTVKVTKLDSRHGFPLASGESMDHTFTIAAISSGKRGVISDPSISKVSEETFLASSTLSDKVDGSDMIGIIVQYTLKVSVHLSALTGCIEVDLPFMLVNKRLRK